ncbi:MAG: hypothetical protein DI570_05545 [Phenylobacterium zucineum]|nr:MAG: hypothetical protein DI570_05545 [Phenylobacterium zucineum]
MAKSPRRLVPVLAGLALAAVAGVAVARDYIVVSSTDPALVRGQSFPAGATVSLAPGRTLTLMHASGNLVTVRGAAAGVVMLPGRQSSQVEADRLAIMRTLVAPAPKTGLRATRGGICPDVASLASLDAIALAYQSGCRPVASEALEAWIAAQTPEVLDD